MASTVTTAAIAFAGPDIGQAEIDAVTRVMRSGVIAQGPEVARFEQEFADWVGASHAVAVNSGTTALELALEALEIGPGDEVIVPSFTFIATAATVARRGALVRFADVDEATFCIDPADVARKTSANTRLVVPVDLYGAPADVPGIRNAVPAGVKVLEDAAQAHGAARHGNRVGSDELTTFSFYPTKNMTTAEGGMITCPNEEVAARLRVIRNHGMHGAYEYERLGTNARMTDIGAAIGRCQLAKLDGYLERRSAIAAAYLGGIDNLQLPTPIANGHHAWSVFTVRHEARDQLADHLASRGVSSKVYYPEPLHRLPIFASSDECPVTDRLATSVLSLPIRPDMTDQDVDRIIDACRSFR